MLKGDRWSDSKSCNYSEFYSELGTCESGCRCSPFSSFIENDEKIPNNTNKIIMEYVNGEKQQKTKNIAYIIGHKSADDFRVKNLGLTVEWLLKVKEKLSNDNINLIIIIVEQSDEPTVKQF